MSLRNNTRVLVPLTAVLAILLAVGGCGKKNETAVAPVSYTHLTLPTNRVACSSRWSPYH